MQIRHPGKPDLGMVKRLWSCCFEKEDEPFFSWFFSHRYCSQNTLGVFDDSSLLAALHIVPYTLRLRSADIACGYIVGVATFPEHRRRGMMASLLAAAIEQMREREQWISVLVPRVPSVYTPHGWELCYHTLRYRVPVGAFPPAAAKRGFWRPAAGFADAAVLDEIYREYMRAFHGHVRRSASNWHDLITENQSEGGELYVLELDGKPAAYVMILAAHASLIIKEMAYTSVQAKSLMFHFFHERMPGEAWAEWQSPLADSMYLDFADAKEGIRLYPAAAGRVIDVTKALANLIPDVLIEGTVSIAVTDDAAPWNCGVFQLSARDGRLSVKKGDRPDVEMPIGSFSQLFFGRLDAGSLVAAGRARVKNPGAISFLNQLFPERDNAIYEVF